MKTDLYNWASHKGTSGAIPVSRKTSLELTAVSPGWITVIGVYDDEDIPIHCGEGRIYLKTELTGAYAVRVDCGNKTAPLGLTVKVNGKELSEPMDKEPAPAKKPPANYLQAMRRKVQEEMAMTREMFINDTGLPGYESDDDDLMFEEEEIANVETNNPDEGGNNDDTDSGTGGSSDGSGSQEGSQASGGATEKAGGKT